MVLFPEDAIMMNARLFSLEYRASAIAGGCAHAEVNGYGHIYIMISCTMMMVATPLDAVDVDGEYIYGGLE